ncbi:hypothetical protein GCM10009718_24520 [Isoptericola halotolerans]|uniref:NAD-dependent epimerase/dehydratase domain-containing protein n=1 Tax=Isoptericola halotolerans TaxID=300560 RepID=A0ABX2A7T6_9MICO|nr:NAD-dependent epimerase/dehydratase family protein [Isoptericola halotolerans]NOV97983.1 hypothetical protein [Isoptericola halotolerans]
MKALVLGARGAVGQHVVAALRGHGHDVTPAGRSGSDGGVRVDLSAPDGAVRLREAAAGQAVVINASGVEEPWIAGELGGAALVDISASSAYLVALRACAAPSTSVVLGAGLVPGLSTVLVGALETRPGDEVDVAVMLGSGEKHGAAAVSWTEKLVGTDVHAPPEGVRVRNLRTRRRVVGPDGRRRTYLRTDFADHVLLDDLVVRSWLTLSNGPATAALALVGRLGKGRRLISGAPLVGSEEWSLQATVRRTAQRLAATGSGQSRATGLLTALAAERVVSAAPGRCVTMADVVAVDDALGVLEPPLSRVRPAGR